MTIPVAGGKWAGHALIGRIETFGDTFWTPEIRVYRQLRGNNVAQLLLLDFSSDFVVIICLKRHRFLSSTDARVSWMKKE